jgi:transposase
VVMSNDRPDGQGLLVEVEVEAAASEGVGRAPVGAEKTFRSYDPDQVLLISPVLGDWVPEGDLAHFVSDLVEGGALDLSAIYASYEGERGQPPYDPRLMVKVLLYGYATGVMSSRKLEAGSYRDIALRMLCADQHPDFRSIARFRARHLDALAGLFVQALRLCKAAGLVGLGALAVDGTKLRANASRHKAMSYERMGPKATKLEAEIAALTARMAALLAEGEAIDAAEDQQHGPDRRGDELPAELARRETRLVKIREAMAALETEAREAEEQRREQMAAEGKKPRQPPHGRDPFKPKPKAQRNFTDPDSKIMKTADGSYHQCFNGQAIVDSVTQVIVAADAFDMAADCPLLEPMLNQLAENLAAIGAVLPVDAAMIADAGYLSEENVKHATDHRVDPHIASGRFKDGEPPELAPEDPLPADATPKQTMARKTRTEPGRAVYARRKAIVEPVFGQMDTTQDARQLLIRGKPAARKQWKFECAVHNLLKLHRNGGLAVIAPG